MPTLYAARGGSSASNLYTVNPSTGVMTSVGATGYAITGLAVEPGTGTLYAVTSNSSPIHARALLTLDKTTGAVTYIGQLGLSQPITDIAFKSDGTLYGIRNDVTLYTINKSTGAATLVGGLGPGGQGNGFEIDAADKGYLFSNGLTNEFDEIYDLSAGTAFGTGSALVIGTLDDAGGAFGANDVAAASFDASGVMWGAISDGSSPGTFVTIATDGTVTVVGSVASGLGFLDALAWDGSVKPDPWFVPIESITVDFDTAPVPDADNCSTPGAMVSTDGASQGSSAIKVDAATADSWVEFDNSTLPPTDFDWLYTSFAVYVPSWSDLWDGGAAWAPILITLDPTIGNNPCFIIQPTSSSAGVIRFNGPGSPKDSTAVPDGQWTAVECAYTKKGDGSFSGHAAVRYWIDNVDSGQLNTGGTWSAPGAGVVIGDLDWFGSPPTDANVTYYADDLHVALQRIGPVDLSGAFFNGVGSGTDTDACSATIAHPVDDPSYTTFDSHTLNVPAPGVMTNDIFPTSVTLNTGPANGSVILNSDGSFSYTPNPGYLGADTFTYNGNGGTATVTITVGPATDPHPIFHGEHGFRAIP